MIEGPKQGKKGLYVTVENHMFSQASDRIRVKLNTVEDIVFTSQEDTGENTIQEKIVEETDEEAMNRIATRFQILDQMSKACIQGDIKGLIVSGPPGVGKSFGVEKQLEKSSILDVIAEKKLRYEVVKGATTALGLYAKLYEYSDPTNVLVFDDCDSVFFDDLALNILKAALDSSNNRKICWNSDSRMLKKEGIPNSFVFRGSVIFITNLKFSNVKSKKLQDHLEAIESRCHFLDLTIDTERDKILRVRQIHRDTPGGLFESYRFNNNEDQLVLDFMEQNQKKLREVSIRMALKLADLIKVNPKDWKNLAVNTCMRRGKVAV